MDITYCKIVEEEDEEKTGKSSAWPDPASQMIPQVGHGISGSTSNRSYWCCSYRRYLPCAGTKTRQDTKTCEVGTHNLRREAINASDAIAPDTP